VFITSVISSPSDATAVVVLKSPHSGSSWFVSLIDKMEGVYLTQEMFEAPKIMKRQYRSLFQVEIKSLPYLVESFQHPMGRYPFGRIPTNATNWKVLGETIDPAAASYLNYTALSIAVPDLRLIHYWRSNKVKHAISTIRAHLLMKACGMMVYKADKAGKDCVIPRKKIVVGVNWLRSSLNLIIRYDNAIYKTISEMVSNLKRKTWYTVTYEELLDDQEKVLQDLLAWTTNSSHKFVKTSHGLPTECMVNCTKITSDNLRDVVSNYEEIEEWLRVNFPCLLPQYYEEKPYVVQPKVQLPCVSR